MSRLLAVKTLNNDFVFEDRKPIFSVFIQHFFSVIVGDFKSVFNPNLELEFPSTYFISFIWTTFYHAFYMRQILTSILCTLVRVVSAVKAY